MLPLFLYSYSNYNKVPISSNLQIQSKYEDLGDIRNYKKYVVDDKEEEYLNEQPAKKGSNVFEQMLIDISDLTKSITDKGLKKLDKLNNFSDTVIDKGNDTVQNTSESLNNIISNISSISNIFKSENFYYFIGIIFLVIVIIKKI